MRHRHATAAVLALLAACGGARIQAHKTLATALTATNAARDSFIAWDKEHQLQIIDHAAAREQAEAELKVYRHKRADVLYAFTAAYTAIAAAATAASLAERNDSDLATFLLRVADAVKATTGVKLAVDALQGSGP